MPASSRAPISRQGKYTRYTTPEVRQQPDEVIGGVARAHPEHLIAHLVLHGDSVDLERLADEL